MPTKKAKPAVPAEKKDRVSPMTLKQEEIQLLRAKIAQLETEAEGYRLTAQAAIDQSNMLKEEMDKMRNFYLKTMTFCNTQTQAFADTIKMVTKGEF